MPQHVTNLVFKSLVLPIFDYCDIVWCFTYEKHLKKLDILQKRAARVITFSNINENTEELIRTLNWLPTRKRFELHTLCYIFKALNKLGSNVSSNYFEIVTKFSQRTGDSLKLKLPNIKTNFLVNTIFYKGINIYNDLSFDIRNSDKFDVFKRHVMNIL